MSARSLAWLLPSIALSGCPGGTSLASDGADSDADVDILEVAEDDGAGEVADEATEAEDATPREDGFFPAVCGDGILDPGEECDDGDRMNGDGCDWECRIGDGSFDYPEPDPSVPVVTPAAPPVEVVAASEAVAVRDDDLELIWGGGRYALVYGAELPYPSLRVRILDKEGNTVAGPWEQPVAWSVPRHATAWTGSEFAVFIWESESRTMTLARLDTNAAPVAPVAEVEAPSPATEWADLMSVVWGNDRFLVAGTYWDLATVSAAGAPIGPRVTLGGMLDGTNAMTQAIALPDGFAVTNVRRLAVFDPDLNLTGWSGVIPDIYAAGSSPLTGGGGDDTVATTDDGLLYWWVANFDGGGLDEGSPDVGDLWAAKTDFAGTVVLPPRRIMVDATRANDGFRTVAGPAGVGVALNHVADPDYAGCEIWLLTSDRWANLRTEPIIVVDADHCGRAYRFALAADDTGFAMAFASSSGPGADVLQFGRFDPAP